MKKIRESNFELLRCILMFMVVLVHYNHDAMGKAFAYVTPGTLNYYFVYFMESLAIIGTNGFVLLTGYFSWKKENTSLRKPFGLLLYVIAYKVLLYGFSVLLGQEIFSIKGVVFSLVPSNWYITLYVVLALLSPYINHMVKDLTKKSFMVLLTVMFLAFSVWPTLLDVVSGISGISMAGINTVALNGADSGYSIVNFVMLYLIGAFISKFGVMQYKQRWDILGYVLCTCIICIQEIVLCEGWSYANPLVILSCVFFLNVFRKMHFSSKFINYVSKASLGVFLIHTNLLITNSVWSKCGIETACKGTILNCAWNMLWVCSLTYVCCSAFDILCRFIVSPVSKWLDKVPVLNKNYIGTHLVD